MRLPESPDTSQRGKASEWVVSTTEMAGKGLCSRGRYTESSRFLKQTTRLLFMRNTTESQSRTSRMKILSAEEGNEAPEGMFGIPTVTLFLILYT